MTRQLTDVLNESLRDFDWIVWPDRLVTALLSEPCEHTVVCPVCAGTGVLIDTYGAHRGIERPCPDCTNGRRTVRIGVLP